MLTGTPKAPSTKFLDYFAFFILYIGCFYFMYQKFTEIIGISTLFVVNAAFMFFVVNEILVKNATNIIPLFANLSIIVGTLFHFISLIFVIMMISNLNTKYTSAYGTPINLPPIFADKMEGFKQYMIFSFVLGSIIMVMLLNGKSYEMIDIVPSMKNVSNPVPIIITILASTGLMVFSSIQIATATEFSKLSRQELIR